jgi:hypothetical protein
MTMGAGNGRWKTLGILRSRRETLPLRRHRIAWPTLAAATGDRFTFHSSPDVEGPPPHVISVSEADPPRGEALD